MPFTMQLRVRYAEVDSQGVVFNANWLLYADEAVTRYVEHLGWSPKELWAGDDAPFDLMVRASALDFRGSAGFEDEVTIEVVPTRLGSSSFDLRMTASVDGRDAVTVTTTYVTVSPSALTKIDLPEELRARLTAELVTA